MKNNLRIKDVLIMNRSGELFISATLNTPFILDNKIWTGFPFEKKISNVLGVTEAEADYYLRHCMTVFSKSAKITHYKQMDANTLLNECIKEIRRGFDIDTQRRHSHDVHSNHKKYDDYHVHLSSRNNNYHVKMDSDDELPPPPNHFGKWFQDGASAAGHA